MTCAPGGNKSMLTGRRPMHSAETKAEIIRLRKDENMSVLDIATRFKMNLSTVANICAQGAPRRFVPSRGASSGYFPPKPESQCTRRQCLMCREYFPSEHAGHRRCDPCQEVINNSTEFDTEYELAGVRLR